MELFVIILIVVVIIGALLGGRSFGGTIRKGCGFIVFLFLIIIGASLYLYWINNDPAPSEEVSPIIKSGYFIVKQNCGTYEKPNIDSEISGYLETGQELYIKNINKYKYFYEFNKEDGKKSYVLKDHLRIKLE